MKPPRAETRGQRVDSHPAHGDMTGENEAPSYLFSLQGKTHELQGEIQSKAKAELGGCDLEEATVTSKHRVTIPRE